jgi:3-dehydroquinate synthase
MNFTINNTVFTDNDFSNNILSDHLKIKSFNKVYDVIYQKLSLNEILTITFTKNDFVLIDRNIYNLYKCEFLIQNDNNIYIYDAIEDNKTIESVLDIIDVLYSKNFSKKNKLIVIGGGITQDVGGFVSSIFKRGIPWILIPTTLLAITDSAIGSKVNVNRHSKNMLGLFNAPDKIYISNKFLSTLTNDELMSGIGESYKLCLIGGSNVFNIFQENLLLQNYEIIIKLSILVKKMVIEHDELEKDERRALNYGHECAHALESVSEYAIPHGISVLYGMLIVNKLFDVNDKYYDINAQIYDLIPNKFKKINLSYEIFIKHLLNDKKNDGTNICFIVLDDIGKISFQFRQLNVINDKLKEIFLQFFQN